MPETCEGKDMTELEIGRYTESDDDAGRLMAILL